MKEQEEEDSSVLFDGTLKPPDRSTSAPPVLSLQPQSLFAFRAAEHLQLFSDIRCEENYFEFYKRYQNQDKLPPPLQTQPFLVDRSFIVNGEGGDVDGPPHPHPHPHGYDQPRYSVPHEARMVPPVRPGSNPQFVRQPMYESYDPSRLVDDIPAGSPTNEAIWTPLPRKMANLVLDDFPTEDNTKRHFYQNADFDVAYSKANLQQKEDNIQSIWTGSTFHNQNNQHNHHNQHNQHNQHNHNQLNHGQHFRGSNGVHITAPTPTMPSQSSPLLSFNNNQNNHHSNNNALNVNNNYNHQDRTTSPQQPLSPRHRSNSGNRSSVGLPPLATTPPLVPNNGNSASPTSPSIAICRYFAQGFCSRGERCNFLHEADPSAPPQTPTTPTLSATESKMDNFPKAKAKKAVASPPPLSSSTSLLSEPPAQQQPPVKKPGLTALVATAPMPSRPPIVPLSSSTSSLPAPRSNGLTELIFGNGPLSPMSNGAGANSPLPPTSPPTTLSPSSSSSNLASSSSKGDIVASRQYTSIDQVVGHIYSLCKDQHGCRFLQKKLEDKDPHVVEYIFNEVYDQMSELMIDPFGNYLCQKLLEHCDDQQRLSVIERVAIDLVKISKNMHGTRAVQKMIEFLTTPEQIAIIKRALANSVVPLIQDLNGNHVIQRCLNRLSPNDNQFIYDSVSQTGNCVEVATHRHGCCVLQRCIDHASDSQKLQLINEVIANALVLVQDPYGNYVVQYVLDLPFQGLASELARRFLGHIPILSTQKFSSNVIEKCLNVADASTRAVLIQELVEYDNLLYLLQDPYANYVIQTSLNVSEPMQHARLVEAIRPHLAALRNTPYGKRIQNKILKESSRDYY